jgi:hypothetical protein
LVLLVPQVLQELLVLQDQLELLEQQDLLDQLVQQVLVVRLDPLGLLELPVLKDLHQLSQALQVHLVLLDQ